MAEALQGDRRTSGASNLKEYLIQDLEIKTKSVEAALAPLITQVGERIEVVPSGCRITPAVQSHESVSVGSNVHLNGYGLFTLSCSLHIDHAYAINMI